jgi:DNA polymerase I-like protein with 3'-5' exonuclease and polymerase domains
MDREEAKILTLKQINSSALTEYENLEFFRKVTAYKDKLWDEFQYGGSIEVPISNHRFYRSELENMNPGKLLNYVLQATETALNVKIMWDMFKVLRGKKTKLVMCTYDAFLFDWDKNEKEEIKQILNVFKKYKLNTKFKQGTSYDFSRE